MCKDATMQEKAREMLFSQFRGEALSDVREFYDGDDLLGFLVGINRTEAYMFDVARDASLRFYRHICLYRGMSDRRAANDFGVPNARVVRYA